MKLIILTLLILLQTNCVNPKDNQNRNLVLGALLLRQSNFELKMQNSSASLQRDASSPNSNLGILNDLTGSPVSSRGDGLSDGYQDKFRTPYGVSLAISSVLFFEKGKIPIGQENVRNYDKLTNTGWEIVTDRFSGGVTSIDSPDYFQATSLSTFQNILGSTIDARVLSGKYDRIGIGLSAIYYAFDKDTSLPLGTNTILGIGVQGTTPDNVTFYKPSIISFPNQICNSTNADLRRCRIDVRNNGRPQRMSTNIIDNRTGYHSIPRENVPVTIPNKTDISRDYARTEYITRNTANVAYTNNPSNNPVEPGLWNPSDVFVILKILTPVVKTSYSKISIIVDANNTFFWDSNSNSNVFRANVYPEIVQRADSTVDWDATNAKGGDAFKVCTYIPQVGRCYQDAWENPPDFRTWNNPEAPIPSIGKDMKVYMPVMYAVME